MPSRLLVEMTPPVSDTLPPEREMPLPGSPSGSSTPVIDHLTARDGDAVARALSDGEARRHDSAAADEQARDGRR